MTTHHHLATELSGTRILVTGGAGLIGAASVAHLAEIGAQVTVYDRDTPQAADRAKRAGALRYVAGDVTDVDQVARSVAGQDAVVHLAGLAGPDRGTAEEIYAANTLGTFIVLNAAARAGAAKVVYASSINASGLPLNPHPVLPTAYPWDEEEPEDIGDAYSLSKQANEAAALALARRHGLSLTGLRFPLVRDITAADGTTFGAHVRQALANNPRRQACEGWTYLDVHDAAIATVAALTHDTPAAPGILIAAPRTYLRQDTVAALDRHAPNVPRVAPIAGRDIPVSLARATRELQFQATVFLEDINPGLLADLDGVHP